MLRPRKLAQTKKRTVVERKPIRCPTNHLCPLISLCGFFFLGAQVLETKPRILRSCRSKRFYAGAPLHFLSLPLRSLFLQLALLSSLDADLFSHGCQSPVFPTSGTGKFKGGSPRNPPDPSSGMFVSYPGPVLKPIALPTFFPVVFPPASVSFSPPKCSRIRSLCCLYVLVKVVLAECFPGYPRFTLRRVNHGSTRFIRHQGALYTSPN